LAIEPLCTVSQQAIRVMAAGDRNRCHPPAQVRLAAEFGSDGERGRRCIYGVWRHQLVSLVVTGPVDSRTISNVSGGLGGMMFRIAVCASTALSNRPMTLPFLTTA
jgi:hypothetical protein